MLSATHELDDGSRVRLRLTRPTDLARIEAFLGRLRQESLVRRFAFSDPRERLTLAATRPGEGGEEIIGLADVALQPAGIAEIGVVVDDESQGVGLGKRLSEAVATLAIQRGATHLKAELREDHEAMMQLLHRLGRTVSTIEDGTTVAYTRLPAARARNVA
jgi:GNAT superfamily N-acetyltransferase